MRIVKVLTALCVVILVMGGCDNLDPNPPRLIYPEEGGVFTVEAPRFEWGLEVKATEYTIRICRDSFPYGDVLIEDTLQDTTYTMPQDVFDEADTGTYAWAVACLWEDDEPLWSNPRTFEILIEKTISQLLYNTYFPMDTGYEWVYKRVEMDWAGDDCWREDIYDVSVKVDSVTEMDNGWISYYLNTDFYYDVGRQVMTNGNEIIISGGEDTISTNSYQNRWRGDYSLIEIQREKGTGVVYQYHTAGACYGTCYIDTLRYFRKGDTTWRYE